MAGWSTNKLSDLLLIFRNDMFSFKLPVSGINKRKYVAISVYLVLNF